MTTLTPITDKQLWESSVTAYPEANFLQSWNWGVFNEALGRKVWRLGWQSGTDLVALTSVVKEQAKRGTYLTLAGGPLLNWSDQNIIKQVFADLRELAKTEKASFVRFRPQAQDDQNLRQLIKSLGAEESPMHVTADLTVQLDLTKPAEQLLAEMRKNTRYEVRRAEKLGIQVTQSSDEAEIKRFHDHQLWLVKQHNFVPFSYEFWLQQFRAFATDDQVKLFHATLNGEILASAFIIFYNKEAVYHYATSTAANAKLPGSYAIQWAVIQEAQRRGCTRYNLWGIAPPDRPDHRFAGVTTFKTGFSDQVVQYLPAHDLPVSWHYGVVKQFENLRRKIRKL